MVLWAGNRAAASVGRDDLAQLINDAGASAIEWTPRRRDVKLPSGQAAVAVEAPVGAALGVLWGIRSLVRGREIDGA